MLDADAWRGSSAGNLNLVGVVLLLLLLRMRHSAPCPCVYLIVSTLTDYKSAILRYGSDNAAVFP